MSLGGDESDVQRQSAPFADRPKLRAILVVVAAIVTLSGVAIWLALTRDLYSFASEPLGAAMLRATVAWCAVVAAFTIAFVFQRWSNARWLILFIGLAVGAFVVVNVMSDRPPSFRRYDPRINMIAALAIPAALVTVTFIFASLPGAGIKDQLRFDLPERKRILAFVIPLICWGALIFLWRFTPFNPVAHPDAPNRVAEIHAAFSGNALATIAYLALAVPITEELFFRGLIANQLLKTGSVTVAVLTAAAIFAAFHIDPQYFSLNQVLFVFCIGIVIVGTFFATKSIWPGVVVHATNNFGVAVVYFVQ